MCQICRIKSGKFITPFTDSQQASNHWMQNLDFNCTTISVSKTNRSADHTDCTLEQQRHESSSYHQYNSHQLKSICMQTSFKCSTEMWADASPYTRGIISREVTLTDSLTVTNEISATICVHEKIAHHMYFIFTSTTSNQS